MGVNRSSTGSYPGRMWFCIWCRCCRTGSSRRCYGRSSKFAKVLVIQLLPGTQGIYGLLVAFVALSRYGLLGAASAELSVATGLMVMAACLPIGIVGLVSAIHQGKTAVASIGIVAKKPDQFGKAMLFPAMVETYAILALLISILALPTV